MKKYGWMGMLAFSLLLGAACSDDDDDDRGGNDGYEPEQAVLAAFQEQYPGALEVEWEAEGSYRKVDFRQGRTDYEAYYTQTGAWLQTAYEQSYTAVPQAVQNRVNQNLNYSSWAVDERTEVVERKAFPVWYGVGLEKGNTEVTLWTDKTGYDEFDAAEDYDGADIPDGITAFINLNYKTALTDEVFRLTNGSFRAYIFDGADVKLLEFDRDQNWISVSWPVTLEALPQAVRSQLNKTLAQGFAVREISYVRMTEDDYYRFSLMQTELSGPDITLKIRPDGSIVIG